jgi:hypothetical protein
MRAISWPDHPGALDAPQVARDGPLREHEAELLQFAMDFWRAPVGVLLCQEPNQDANFLVDPWPATTRPRFPTPIQPGTSSTPTDDHFGLDDYQRILPARPGRPQDRPEEPIQRAQGRSGPPAFQHRHLLAKGENFHSVRLWKKTRTAAKRARTNGSTDWF